MLPRLILLLLLLSGCGSTPYVAVRHIDATPAQGGNDAWDVGCVGIKSRDRLNFKVDWCKNIRGGQLAEISIEYELFGRE